MSFLNSITNFFKKRKNNLEIENLTKGTIYFSDYFIDEFIDADNSFEKLFFEYNSFEIIDGTTTYKISLYFPDNTDTKLMEEILSLAKDGFEKKVDCDVLFLNISLLFQLQVYYKGIPDENKLKIFIGNVDV